MRRRSSPQASRFALEDHVRHLLLFKRIISSIILARGSSRMIDTLMAALLLAASPSQQPSAAEKSDLRSEGDPGRFGRGGCTGPSWHRRSGNGTLRALHPRVRGRRPATTRKKTSSSRTAGGRLHQHGSRLHRVEKLAGCIRPAIPEGCRKPIDRAAPCRNRSWT